QECQQFITAQAHVAGSRRHWAGLAARATLEQLRRVAADAVDYLPDLIQGQEPRPANMVYAGFRPGQEAAENTAQIIRIRTPTYPPGPFPEKTRSVER